MDAPVRSVCQAWEHGASPQQEQPASAHLEQRAPALPATAEVEAEAEPHWADLPVMADAALTEFAQVSEQALTAQALPVSENYEPSSGMELAELRGPPV